MRRSSLVEEAGCGPRGAVRWGRNFRRPRDSGATLVEFVVVFPLLIALIVGVLEFGWVFAQYLDIRHGAREGARLATVNYPEGAHPVVVARTPANLSSLLTETCSRMNTARSPSVTFSSLGDVEDPVSVTVTANPDTLTGILDWALPSSLALTSTAVLHAEQESTWSNTDTSTYPDGEPCP